MLPILGTLLMRKPPCSLLWTSPQWLLNTYRNIYGSHPFYLDTRYYEIDATTGNQTLVTSNTTNSSADYVSYSHGVYNRNSHGQEILLHPTNITWRLLGGSIDMYVYAGPTQPEVTAAYQMSAVGLPAMQQYFTFGFHQCRWGYQNWTVLQDVVNFYEEAGIPLENIWCVIPKRRPSF